MFTGTALAICRVVFVVAGINFIAYVGIAGHLGGDAVNGRHAGGRYFLSSHGRDTEVTREVFNYSKYHTYGVWFTHMSAMFAALLYQRLERKQASPM